ncbi:LacI family transcriptional regulator [Capsulimonas corticalis]|uniref:LacI family transcriptional regulator n=1 Tax=Capsulimonas corticalis TaxID=2219043 RepID=A0A402D6Y9_9BACT|nr:LacI family DNA-binding transcriptional regulator [Capsulimonas corticalis]BDI29319.1 LacI family transcriptional regulator [Capsulimonas corticalis]
MATIYDVAKESGFSLSTISNVLNDGPRPVRPETRARILETMRRLDYHPSAVARGLARRRTNNLGILFGVVESAAIVINAYSAAILQGVLTTAAERGYNITHLTTPWRGKEYSLSQFRDGRTDGVLVVAPPTDSDLIPALASLKLPLVAVSWPPERTRVPLVEVDDVHGAQMIMDHLLGLGHRRIGHLMGHGNLLSAVVRRETYDRRLAEADIFPNPEYVLPGMYSTKSGYENGRRLLSLPEPPTAIFAGNDEIAFGVIEAARDMGVAIPGQLSIAGVDDRPLAAYMTPPLTTVRQPFVQMGAEAARLLIQRVEGDDIPATTYLFQPELIVRGSTAPPVK